jgi:hypothetical protein
MSTERLLEIQPLPSRSMAPIDVLVQDVDTSHSESVLKNGFSEQIPMQLPQRFWQTAPNTSFFDGTDQYSGYGTGASTCGLAALKCARVVLSIEQGSLQDAVVSVACIGARVRQRAGIVRPPRPHLSRFLI